MNTILNIFEFLWYLIKFSAFNLLIGTAQVIYAAMWWFFFISIMLIVLFLSGSSNGLAEYIKPIMPSILFIVLIILFIALGFFIIYLEEKIVKKYSLISKTTKVLNALLFNIERKHSLWKVRKYLSSYSNIKKNLKIQNDNVVVYIGAKASKTVVCQDKKSKRKISTKLKEFLRKGSRRVSWAYTDIWNIICLNFNDKTTYDDISRSFAINDKSSTYNSFFSHYKFCMKFENEINSNKKNHRINKYKIENQTENSKQNSEDLIIERQEDNIPKETTKNPILDTKEERQIDI